MKREPKDAVDLFVVYIVAMLFLGLIFTQGCSTLEGGFRDTKWISEQGIRMTRKATEAQRKSGIAFGIEEQNSIMQQGQEMYTELQR